MLAKNNSMQQPNRRTPLSLGSSMKPSKSNDKNDNNKKESTANNQKTENLKKDSQMERKNSADKKQSSSDAKRSSSTSSTDSRKQDDHKTNKNDDNKKNQNGVNGNGKNSKDKDSNKMNEVVVKIKSDSAASANGNASNKKESQKQADKKKEQKEPAAVEVVAKNDNNKETVAEKTKEAKDAKNEENKNKAAEKNEEKPATVEVSNTQSVNQEKKEIELAAEKKNDEKTTEVQKPSAQESVVIIELEDTIIEDNATKSEETTTGLKTPIKENKAEEPTTEEDAAMLDNPSEDVEMMESLKYIEEQPTSCSVFAVSTPAKNRSPKEALNLFDVPTSRSPKSEVKLPKESLTHTPDRKSCPRTFSSISGRRSIRPIGDYTFSGNLQIRESYRKINTELDFTTSSLNVTVGSEVPNNESFSFFSRSRKRDRSSPTHASTMELQNDLSPKSPKRARVDNGGGGAMYGFFNAMASPITMLRARLARASVQSTPKKLIVDQIEQEIVENVSAIAVEAIEEDLTATEEQNFNPDSTVADVETVEEPPQQPAEETAKCSQQNPDLPSSDNDDANDDIKIKETITATDSQAKKRCSIM